MAPLPVCRCCPPPDLPYWWGQRPRHSSSESHLSSWCRLEGGREGERKGGREGGRERREGRERGREGEREEGREGGKKGRREGGREGSTYSWRKVHVRGEGERVQEWVGWGNERIRLKPVRGIM